MNKIFDDIVCSIEFRVSTFDACLYPKAVDSRCVLPLFYMDNVLMTITSLDLIAMTKADLKTRFETTDHGECTFVLRIE